MKIDEGCINHNVDRLIAELTETLYEWIDNNDNTMIATLGEIRGIHTLAEALKEVLKM